MSRRQNDSGIQIKRAKFDSLLIYEVTEEELDQLSKGSPDSLNLLFAIFFLTEASTFWVVLATVNLDATSKTFITFLLLTIAGFSVGGVLLIKWLIGFRSTKPLIKKIKERMEDEAIPLTAESADPTAIVPVNALPTTDEETIKKPNRMLKKTDSIKTTTSK